MFFLMTVIVFGVSASRAVVVCDLNFQTMSRG